MGGFRLGGARRSSLGKLQSAAQPSHLCQKCCEIGRVGRSPQLPQRDQPQRATKISLWLGRRSLPCANLPVHQRESRARSVGGTLLLRPAKAAACAADGEGATGPEYALSL